MLDISVVPMKNVLVSLRQENVFNKISEMLSNFRKVIDIVTKV